MGQVQFQQCSQVIDVSQGHVVQVEVGGEPPQEFRAEGRRNFRMYRRDVAAGYGRRYSGFGGADVADAQVFRQGAVGAGDGNGKGLSHGECRSVGKRRTEVCVVFVAKRRSFQTRMVYRRTGGVGTEQLEWCIAPLPAVAARDAGHAVHGEYAVMTGRWSAGADKIAPGAMVQVNRIGIMGKQVDRRNRIRDKIGAPDLRRFGNRAVQQEADAEVSGIPPAPSTVPGRLARKRGTFPGR